MLAMGPRDLNSTPYSPVHCSSHSMTSFHSSELTELPVVENSQLFAQRVHSARYAPFTSAPRSFDRRTTATQRLVDPNNPSALEPPMPSTTPQQPGFSDPRDFGTKIMKSPSQISAPSHRPTTVRNRFSAALRVVPVPQLKWGVARPVPGATWTSPTMCRPGCAHPTPGPSASLPPALSWVSLGLLSGAPCCQISAMASVGEPLTPQEIGLCV